MAASVFDSALFAKLFPTGEAARLFSDSAAVRAMLLVEGALAKVQGAAGLIPETSAAAIHRASLEIAIDPGALAMATGQNGVSVPALVAAFRDEMQAPEHAQFIHWGATSQDIIDTGLMLRLRQVLVLAENDLRSLLGILAEQAEAHATLPMVGRTYGQAATPTSWGAVLAAFGTPLCDALEALSVLRENALWVSLSGAAGTSSMLGGDPARLRGSLAEQLGLGDPGRSWHTDRGPILRIAAWMGDICTTLGATGETMIGLAASGIEEISFGDAGGSSTMPQKQNPVAASALVALARQSAALRAGLPGAAMHQHQRDGAAWFTEWMLLPQIVLSTMAALQIAQTLLPATSPNAERMAAILASGHGLIHAEALSFALASRMPRPEAQRVTKELCARARDQAKPLREVARAAYPDLPDTLFDPGAQMGTAPADARAFAARIRAL